MNSPETRLGLPIVECQNEAAFSRWLKAQPRSCPGIWLKLAKKGVQGLHKAQAIDQALCHGWIDGQQHPYDANFWLTRFTPRRRNSRWSQINRIRALELIASGLMQPEGSDEIEAARADGRWEAAYAPASTAQPSPEFQAALDAVPGAASAFAALNSADRYSILHRMSNLKTVQGRNRMTARVLTKLGHSAR